LWDGTQTRRFLSVTSPGGTGVLPFAVPPLMKGVSPLQARGERLFTRVVVEVPREGDARQESSPIGYVVLSRVVRPQSPSVITGMVGQSATILIGNRSGGVWTDLEKLAPAPAFDTTSVGAHEFTSASGARMIGAAVPIANTPWTMVIELARDPIVAPAWSLLRRLTGVGLVLLVLTTIVAALLGGQVTRPLADLTRATETIAAGDYSSRVHANRRDEVGQLGQAFNDMAARVEQAHNALALRAEDLAESREAAQRANRVKDQFLAVLSHELRTPLTAMLGWCRMLRDGIVPAAKTGHALEVIERNAVAQLRLVEDLLDVSRIVAGKFAVDLQLVDPTAIVHAAVESIQPLAAAKHIDLETHLDPQVGHVHGDPGRLQQAVWNLLSNAIKFTPAGGKVDVSVARTGGGIDIVVHDTGEGISDDVLPLVFDRFQQDDTAATGRRHGLGLGLAIVRQVIDRRGECGESGASSPRAERGVPHANRPSARLCSRRPDSRRRGCRRRARVDHAFSRRTRRHRHRRGQRARGAAVAGRPSARCDRQRHRDAGTGRPRADSADSRAGVLERVLDSRHRAHGVRDARGPRAFDPIRIPVPPRQAGRVDGVGGDDLVGGQRGRWGQVLDRSLSLSWP
jgi:signal transduction histidine kinase